MLKDLFKMTVLATVVFMAYGFTLATHCERTKHYYCASGG